MRNNKGVTLIALIITILVIVIISAVVIRSVSTDNLVGRATDGALETEYETQKEKLIAALYHALLESFVSEKIEFQYAKIPEILVEILDEEGEFESQLINPDDNGFAIYEISPKGKNIKFKLTISNKNGAYEIERIYT